MDIGALTGAVEIEDQFTTVFDAAIRSVEAFGEKFADSFGGVGIGIGIAATAVVGLTAAVTALASKGSDVNDVTSSFEHFAEKVDGAEASLEALQRGTKGTVDDMILMKDAAKVMGAGAKLSAEDLETLSSAAFALQNRGLGPTKDMLDLVTTAMVTGRTRTLSMRLGIVDAADSTQEYADKLGILKSELTDTQQAEARRMAVMKMLKGVVQDAGEQQLDFGEKIERVEAQISNWVDELAAAVASSPHVTRAVDSIIEALSHFSDSEESIHTLVGWIDKFSDAVADYGPSVISTLIGIKNSIAFIVTTVTESWNMLPDWLKTVVKDATLAGIGLYALKGAVNMLTPELLRAGDAESDVLGKLSNSATITDASISVSKLGAEFKALRLIINEGGEALGLQQTFSVVGGGSVMLATLAGKVTLIVAAITTLISVGTVAYQAFKLWTENGERAASAAEQAIVDARNLAILNEKLGTSYKTVAEASAEWIKRQKEAKAGTSAEAEALAALEARQKAYKESVQAVSDSVQLTLRNLNVSRDAYAKLGDAVLTTRDAQIMFVSAMDKIIDSGRALTKAEDDRYELIVRDRLATIQYGEEQLKTQKISIEMIETNKALGLTESELAERYGVTVGALKAYETEMKSLQTLKDEVADLELRASGHAAQAVEAQREREKEAAIRSFKGTSVEFDAFMTAINRKYELLELTGSESWRAVEDSSISSAMTQLQEAQKVLNHMAYSGNYSRAELDKQRAKVDELQASVRGLGDEWESEGDRVIASQKKQQKELDATKRKADELARSLGNTITYDLSSKEGIAQYRSMNSGMEILWSDEAIMDYIMRGGNLAGLMQVGAIRMRGGSRGGMSVSGGSQPAPPPPSAQQQNTAVEPNTGVRASTPGRAADVSHEDAAVAEANRAAGINIGSIQFYGTPADMLKKFEDMLTRQLKLRRQL